MGLRMYLTRLPAERLDALRADPNAWDVLETDLERASLDEGRRDDASTIGGNDELGYAQLDKAWDRLHFVLDPGRREGNDFRATTPAGAAAIGWHATPAFYMDVLELDYAPRYNLAEEVPSIAEALTRIDFEAALADHAEALAAADVYANRGDHEAAKRYLTEWFRVMQQFYADTAQRNQAAFLQLA